MPGSTPPTRPPPGDRLLLPSATTLMGGCGGDGVCERPGFLGGMGGGLPRSMRAAVGALIPICGWPRRPGNGPPSEAEWGRLGRRPPPPGPPPPLPPPAGGLVKRDSTWVTVWRACCLAAKLSRLLGERSREGGLWLAEPFWSCSEGEAWNLKRAAWTRGLTPVGGVGVAGAVTAVGPGEWPSPPFSACEPPACSSPRPMLGVLGKLMPA